MSTPTNLFTLLDLMISKLSRLKSKRMKEKLLDKKKLPSKLKNKINLFSTLPLLKICILLLKILINMSERMKTNFFLLFKDWSSNKKTNIPKSKQNKMNKILRTCLMKKVSKNPLIKKKSWVIKMKKEQKELKCKWERKMNYNLKIKFNTLLMMFSEKNLWIIMV